MIERELTMIEREATMIDEIAVDAVPLKFFWVPYGSFFARVSAMMAWSRKRGRSSPAEKKKEKRYGCGSKKKRCGCDSEEPPTCHCGAHRFKNEEHNRILEEWSYRRKGFDVPKLPFTWIDNLWPVEEPEEVPVIVEMAEFPVEEHNKTLAKQGRMMEFIRIIKVMEEVDCGLKHNITLEVGFTDEEEPRIYQARTYVHAEKELEFVREAPSY